MAMHLIRYCCKCSKAQFATLALIAWFCSCCVLQHRISCACQVYVGLLACSGAAALRCWFSLPPLGILLSGYTWIMRSSSIICWTLAAVVGCAHAASAQHGDEHERKLSSSTRQLQSLQNSDLTLRYADFTKLPMKLPAGNNTVEEVALQGNISITTDAINEPYDVPEGAFHLGPTEVNQIVSAVTTQLVRCSFCGLMAHPAVGDGIVRS